MGIQNLLKHLSEIEQKKNVKAYSGMRVAVDGYCWLHKAVYTCKREMAQGQGLDKLISYVLKRINLLRKHDVTPIMVFDGGKLHAKKGVEDDRQKNRDRYKEMADEYMKEGDQDNAIKMLGMSIDITPKIAHQVIQALKRNNVEYYVAPYEADAQLAYLWFQKHVDVVFTEDSDLLAFGVKKVFFKMDGDGNGVEIDLNNLHKIKRPDFSLFTQDMLLITCILSGCDYLPSVKGIGFVRAQKLVEQCGDGNTYHDILEILKAEPNITIPHDYDEDFKKAFLTFKFQRVYCPKQQKLVTINDPETYEFGKELSNFKKQKFLGKELPNDIAQQIASGDMDPITQQPFPQSSPEEQAMIDRASRRKNNPNGQSSFKSLFIGGNSYNQGPPPELPKFLKQNPHPYYLELWNKHPKFFWTAYHLDKARGTVKYVKKEKRWVDLSDIKFKGQKDEDEKPSKDKKKFPNKKRNREPEPIVDTDSGGESPTRGKACKEAKAKAKIDKEHQLRHDLEIEQAERDHAVDSFISKTDYNKPLQNDDKQDCSERAVAVKNHKQKEKERLDMKTAETLKSMREDEMKKVLKDKEDKLKRIQKYHEKKRIKDEEKKKFLSEIEENAKIANSVKAGAYFGGAMLNPESDFMQKYKPLNKNASGFSVMPQQSGKKMMTLNDLGQNENQFDHSHHEAYPSSGFQVTAPSGKSYKPSESNQAKPTQQINVNMEEDVAIDFLPGILSNPLLPQNKALQEQIAFEALKKLPNGGGKGGNKELEKEFDRIMNPSLHKKKYGHLSKQNLMPPSYIQKKSKGGGKKKDNSDEIDGRIPLSLLAMQAAATMNKNMKGTAKDADPLPTGKFQGQGKCIGSDFQQPIEELPKKRKISKDKEKQIERVAPGFSYMASKPQSIPLCSNEQDQSKTQAMAQSNTKLQQLALERMKRQQGGGR